MNEILNNKKKSEILAEKIKELGETLNKIVSTIQGILDGVVDRLYKLNETNGKLLEDAQKKYSTRYIDGLSKSEIKNFFISLIEMNIISFKMVSFML